MGKKEVDKKVELEELKEVFQRLKEADGDQDRISMIITEAELFFVKEATKIDKERDEKRVREFFDTLMNFYEEALKYVTSRSLRRKILNAVRFWQSEAIYRHKYIEVPSVTIPSPVPKPPSPKPKVPTESYLKSMIENIPKREEIAEMMESIIGKKIKELTKSMSIEEEIRRMKKSEMHYGMEEESERKEEMKIEKGRKDEEIFPYIR